MHNINSPTTREFVMIPAGANAIYVETVKRFWSKTTEELETSAAHWRNLSFWEKVIVFLDIINDAEFEGIVAHDILAARKRPGGKLDQRLREIVARA